MPEISLTELSPDTDVDALVAFLATNSFPFHGRPRMSAEQARESVDAGRYWSGDSIGFWVAADGERIGVAAIDDVDDIDDGGNPVFDLRLGEGARGRRFGGPVLRALTALVFARWPDVSRFEGHTRDDNLAMRATFRSAGWVKEGYFRDGWPVTGEAPRAAVAYAMLRRDWESGATTPVVWDDL